MLLKSLGILFLHVIYFCSPTPLLNQLLLQISIYMQNIHKRVPLSHRWKQQCAISSNSILLWNQSLMNPGLAL